MSTKTKELFDKMWDGEITSLEEVRDFAQKALSIKTKGEPHTSTNTSKVQICDYHYEDRPCVWRTVWWCKSKPCQFTDRKL